MKSVAGVVRANGSSEDPEGYAEKIACRFFPNILPYTFGTAATFGFVKWNVRSLTDNAQDVIFSLASNTPVGLGVAKESVASKPSRTFPYVPAVGGLASKSVDTDMLSEGRTRGRLCRGVALA